MSLTLDRHPFIKKEYEKMERYLKEDNINEVAITLRSIASQICKYYLIKNVKKYKDCSLKDKSFPKPTPMINMIDGLGLMEQNYIELIQDMISEGNKAAHPEGGIKPSERKVRNAARELADFLNVFMKQFPEESVYQGSKGNNTPEHEKKNSEEHEKTNTRKTQNISRNKNCSNVSSNVITFEVGKYNHTHNLSNGYIGHKGYYYKGDFRKLPDRGFTEEEISRFKIKDEELGTSGLERSFYDLILCFMDYCIKKEKLSSFFRITENYHRIELTGEGMKNFSVFLGVDHINLSELHTMNLVMIKKILLKL